MSTDIPPGMKKLSVGGFIPDWLNLEDPDLREIQAKRLWEKGFGGDPNVLAKDFWDYLAGIPRISANLLADDPDLPFLSLADPRPGLVRSSALGFIQYGRNDGDAEQFDRRFLLPATPFWFRHDDGHRNRNRRPYRDWEWFAGDILAGTAMEGVFSYLHHPTIVKEGVHSVDLPGTVRRGYRSFCARLGVWDARAGLGLDRNSDDASFLDQS